jgi:SAM-dependent methyltransferase
MTKESETYDRMGDFYDLIYSEDFDSYFYIREARKCGGKVLELGCGTGRMTIKLMKAGIDVTGLDISEKMLELLRRNARREGLEAKTYLGDMRTFRIPQKFRMAVFPYRSFLHLLTREDRKKTLMNVNSHLEKGGKAIVHVFQPLKDELKNTGKPRHIDTTNVKKDGEGFVLEWFMQYYPESRVADYTIEVRDREGSTVKRFEMTVSFVDIQELKNTFEECGFSNIKIYGGFDYEDYSRSCEEVVVVAEK